MAGWSAATQQSKLLQCLCRALVTQCHGGVIQHRPQLAVARGRAALCAMARGGAAARRAAGWPQHSAAAATAPAAALRPPWPRLPHLGGPALPLPAAALAEPAGGQPQFHDSRQAARCHRRVAAPTGPLQQPAGSGRGGCRGGSCQEGIMAAPWSGYCQHETTAARTRKQAPGRTACAHLGLL